MKQGTKLQSRCGTSVAASMAVPKLSHTITKTQYINVALRVQLDVQRRLHEQLERNLQRRIEAQGKKLQMMFDEQLKASNVMNMTELLRELQGDGNDGSYLASIVEQDEDGGKAKSSGGYDDTGSKTAPPAGRVTRHLSAL